MDEDTTNGWPPAAFGPAPEKIELHGGPEKPFDTVEAARDEQCSSVVRAGSPCRVDRQPQAGRVGLYHLAWQVDTITDLAEMRERLLRLGALVGESDHGVTKSLYAKDPDGNEFEVMWMVPREQWGDMEHEAITQHLDLAAELAKHA